MYALRVERFEGIMRIGSGGLYKYLLMDLFSPYVRLYLLVSATFILDYFHMQRTVVSKELCRPSMDASRLSWGIERVNERMEAAQIRS